MSNFRSAYRRRRRKKNMKETSGLKCEVMLRVCVKVCRARIKMFLYERHAFIRKMWCCGLVCSFKSIWNFPHVCIPPHNKLLQIYIYVWYMRFFFFFINTSFGIENGLCVDQWQKVVFIYFPLWETVLERERENARANDTLCIVITIIWNFPTCFQLTLCCQRGKFDFHAAVTHTAQFIHIKKANIYLYKMERLVRRGKNPERAGKMKLKSNN